MEQDKLQKEIDAIEEIKKIKMTSFERERLLQNILKPSPYYSFVSIFSRKSFVYVGSAICLMLILSGGAVFASGKSLPGNILYPLKVKIVEPVTGAFITSPIAKVEYQNNLAVKRLTEAETLAEEGKLDESKEEQLNFLLETHTIAFDKAVINLRQNENVDKDKNDDIVTSFEATMNAHARILNIVSGKNNTGENADTKISKTAKEKAKKVRDNFRNKEAKQDQDENKNQEQNKEQNKEENQDKDKNIDDEREKLLDSQSSLKEADIFLKAGLRLKVKSDI